MLYLLVIIILRFTCAERKIWSNIKKTQNFITMILAAGIDSGTIVFRAQVINLKATGPI